MKREDLLIRLQEEPLDVAAAVAFVTTPTAGGINVFLGTTRAETHADGRQLIALDYETYHEMAIDRMRTLAQSASEQWVDIARIAILHRTGRVEIGHPSVVIAVSTPHRADAFAACKYLIDSLKKDVPIWKREIWDDGSGSWVHPDATPSPSGRGQG